MFDDFSPSGRDLYAIHYSSTRNKDNVVLVTSLSVVRAYDSQGRSFVGSPQRGRGATAWDELERLEGQLLLEFAEFVRGYPQARYIHWALRSSTFGWYHLWDRMRTHGIAPPEIPFDRLLDLNESLKDSQGSPLRRTPASTTCCAKMGWSTPTYSTGQRKLSWRKPSNWVKCEIPVTVKLSGSLTFISWRPQRSSEPLSRSDEKFVLGFGLLEAFVSP